MSLLALLNSNADKTPDQIVLAISDPFSSWISVPDMTPELHERYPDRPVSLFHYMEGFYTTESQHMVRSRYSYRTMDPQYSTPESTESYDPYTASGCSGWWMIGYEYRTQAPVPTSAGTPEHDTYRYEEYHELDDDA